MWGKHACVAACLLASSAVAQTIEENNFWIVWERTLPQTTDCEAGLDCSQSIYFSHYIDGATQDFAQRFFGRLQGFTKGPQDAYIRTAQSPMCFDAISHTPPPDPTKLPLAEKLDVLAGLEGVFVDLRGMRGPTTYQGEFGAEAHAFAMRIFEANGIPMLTREQAEAHPAHPILSLRYSPEVRGCRPWSVSLSLKQNVQLSRDLRIKLHTSTFATSARQDEENIEFSAQDAVVQALTTFAEAYVQAQKLVVASN